MLLTRLKYNVASFVSVAKKRILGFYYALICIFSKVQDDKIVFCSHQGRTSISCNPKYIMKEILNQNLPFKMVWLCDKEIATKDDEFKSVQFIDFNNTKEKIKALATSKIWIDNAYKTSEIRNGLIKKKNQFYINTWHGSLGIKKLFWDSENISTHNDVFLKCLKKDFENCDLMFSNSKWEEEVYKSAFRYAGKIERVGHPRNDIFFEKDNKSRKKVFKKYGISDNLKVALYIPTFRTSRTLECYDIDYKGLKDSLRERFSGEWIILTKFHPSNYSHSKKALEKYFADIDVTLYPDTQELLMASDVIISDYSSCMFDFMLTKRPCFIYATDIKEYNNDRGFYYPLEMAPFPVAVNNKELNFNILKFDYEKYKNEIEIFLKQKDVFEDGNASKRAVEIIKKMIFGG